MASAADALIKCLDMVNNMNREQIIKLVHKIRATEPRCRNSIRCDKCDRYIPAASDGEISVCTLASEYIVDELIKHGVISTKCIHEDGDIAEMFSEPACSYVNKEKYCNVTVTVAVCEHCGDVGIFWERQDNTEEIPIQED